MSRRQITSTTPTQVAHPVRALLRHLVAAAVGVFLGWLARQGIDAADIAPGLIDWLTGLAWAVATGAAQWVLTLPGVNRILEGTPLSPGVETEDA